MSDTARFEEIMNEIKELTEEALDLTPPAERAPARAYWYPQLLQAVDSDNEYLGSSMCSMRDTLKSIHDMERLAPALPGVKFSRAQCTCLLISCSSGMAVLHA